MVDPGGEDEADEAGVMSRREILERLDAIEAEIHRLRALVQKAASSISPRRSPRACRRAKAHRTDAHAKHAPDSSFGHSDDTLVEVAAGKAGALCGGG
jgi:uncharacterized small protein (DUF1192 family)